jgi:DNA ligase (NAD+)
MIKVASEQDRLIIGTDGPRNAWSIAWKPPIQIATTVVTDIEWNVSRLGRIIPTVVYHPIELCGTTNHRVTGNNAQWILDRKIGIGSTLLVGKAGEIIPKIVKVLQEKVLFGDAAGQTTPQEAQEGVKMAGAGVTGIPLSTAPGGPENANFSVSKFSLPGVCPICESKLTWQGVHLICDSPTCIAKLTVSLSYFYSLKGIKIDGIGEATIEKLLQNQKCYEILKTRPWALLDMLTYDFMSETISILGPKIFHSIFDQIKAVNGTKTMAHFIAGLGLPGLAYKTALRLCQFLKTGKLNIHVSENAKNNFIQAISKYQQALEEMKNFTFAALPQPAKAIYCVTGTLSMSRDAFVEQNSLMGYEFSAGVTRETHYLIVGEEPGRTKITKAEKHNIPMITEDQFNKIIIGE